MIKGIWFSSLEIIQILPIQYLYKQLLLELIMRDKIGNYPYDTKKVNGKLVVSFYPKGEDLKHPDTPKFSLTLDKDDLKKLAKLG